MRSVSRAVKDHGDEGASQTEHVSATQLHLTMVRVAGGQVERTPVGLVLVRALDCRRGLRERACPDAAAVIYDAQRRQLLWLRA